jgi:hypothetical protein
MIALSCSSGKARDAAGGRDRATALRRAAFGAGRRREPTSFGVTMRKHRSAPHSLRCAKIRSVMTIVLTEFEPKEKKAG